MNNSFICLDIGGTKIFGGLICNDELIKTYKLKTDTTSQDTVKQNIFEVISKLLEFHSDVKGIGIGVPGKINSQEGIIDFSPNLPLKNFEISQVIFNEFKIPVKIGNDVNVGLLGEHWKGAAKGYANAVGIFIGTGLGGAVILNNEIIKGAQSLCGEFGHSKLYLEGKKCNCGQNGCAESYASKTSIHKYLIDHGIKIDDSIIKTSTIKELLSKNNKHLKEALKIVYSNLGELIGNIINCLDPDIIVIGGGLAEGLGEKFVKNLKPFVQKRALTDTKIRISKLGDNAIIYGGACLFRS